MPVTENDVFEMAMAFPAGGLRKYFTRRDVRTTCNATEVEAEEGHSHCGVHGFARDRPRCPPSEMRVTHRDHEAWLQNFHFPSRAYHCSAQSQCEGVRIVDDWRARAAIQPISVVTVSAHSFPAIGSIRPKIGVRNRDRPDIAGT